MSLARMLIDAALSADLSQNELRAFLALFKQTVCYGKSNDACTTRRLAGIAHVREDRLPKALAALVDKGIFAREDDKKFNSLWSIPAELLATSAESGIFAPTLLKNGDATQKAGEVTPENGEANPKSGLHITNHTITNPTIKTSTTTDPTPEVFQAWVQEQFGRMARDNELCEFKALSVAERRKFMSVYEEESMPFPNGVDKQRAVQILDGLHPSFARCCLKLLALAMRNNNVQSPMGWLYQTAKKARTGQLDTYRLSAFPHLCEWHQINVIANHVFKPIVVDQNDMPFGMDANAAPLPVCNFVSADVATMRRLSQEIAALNDMEKLAGSLPDVMLEKRQGMLEQVAQLKAKGAAL